jgi:diguanylate cyclase (GGDEF)-like protein
MLNSFKALFRASNPNALTPAGMQPTLSEMAGIKTAQLRQLVLVPVMAVIFITIVTLIAESYRHANEDISREVRMLKTSANKIYEGYLEHSTRMLAGVSATLTQDAQLRRAVERGNTAELSKFVAPIFATLQKEYEITHFYLIGADRTVLLRAHNPSYFGDVINRVTTIDVRRTSAPVHGVELGPQGELALRYVSPLYKDAAKQHLIGFIELGVNTNYLLRDIKNSLGIEMFEFLSKEFLTRDVWRQGMPDSANANEWDRFPDVAPSAQALKDMTPEMSAIMSNRILPTTENMMEVSLGKSDFRAISFPIMDIAEHKTGTIVMIADVTSKVVNARNTLYLGLALGTAGGALLFVFFWLLTGRVGRLIEQHQEALQHMAIRDGLTGLFNHVTFYTMLEDEIARSQRSGTPVSLLMLDLDHFKSVNDKFGHVEGDMVLKESGRIIHRQSRSIDKVCRYGGEEFAVILPETNSAGAMIAADHMRSAIERHLFQTNDGQNISFTISIGVATVPEHAVSAQDLVNAADRALYVAKEHGRNRVYRYNS